MTPVGAHKAQEVAVVEGMLVQTLKSTTTLEDAYG